MKRDEKQKENLGTNSDCTTNSAQDNEFLIRFTLVPDYDKLLKYFKKCKYYH